MSATLKKITTRAKQIYKKRPGMKWTNAVKQASGELKRSGAIGATKKKAPAKKEVVKKEYRQTGTSNKFYDEQRTAKAPGKRKSATGKTYYERRRNRSDMPGTLAGVSMAKLNGAMLGKLTTKLGELYVKRDMTNGKRDKRKIQKQITETKRTITKYRK